MSWLGSSCPALEAVGHRSRRSAGFTASPVHGCGGGLVPAWSPGLRHAGAPVGTAYAVGSVERCSRSPSDATGRSGVSIRSAARRIVGCVLGLKRLHCGAGPVPAARSGSADHCDHEPGHSAASIPATASAAISWAASHRSRSRRRPCPGRRPLRRTGTEIPAGGSPSRRVSGWSVTAQARGRAGSIGSTSRGTAPPPAHRAGTLPTPAERPSSMLSTGMPPPDRVTSPVSEDVAGLHRLRRAPLGESAVQRRTSCASHRAATRPGPRREPPMRRIRRRRRAPDPPPAGASWCRCNTQWVAAGSAAGRPASSVSSPRRPRPGRWPSS